MASIYVQLLALALCACAVSSETLGFPEVAKSAPLPRWTPMPRTQKVTPLLTTGLLTQTMQLFTDVFDTAWDSLIEAHIQRNEDGIILAKKVAVPWPQKAVKKLAKDAGVEHHHETLVQHSSTIMGAIYTHSSTAKVHAKAVFAKLDGFSAQGIKLVESKLPALSGLISPTFWDVMLFVSYMSFVMYVGLRAVLFALRQFKCVFCFFCCCGCIRGGKKVSKQDSKKTSGKAAEKPKVAEKGKAPAQAPAKKGKK